MFVLFLLLNYICYPFVPLILWIHINVITIIILMINYLTFKHFRSKPPGAEPPHRSSAPAPFAPYGRSDCITPAVTDDFNTVFSEFYAKTIWELFVNPPHRNLYLS